VRVTRKEARVNWYRPRTWSATAEAIERTVDKEKAEAKAARLKALRERDE
jgi:hypothetical protein